MVKPATEWAILKILARDPGRTFNADRISQELVKLQSETEAPDLLEPLRNLDDIQILQSGLVSLGQEGLQITDAGISVVQFLEGAPGSRQDGPFSTDPSLIELIEKLASVDDHSSASGNAFLPEVDAESESSAPQPQAGFVNAPPVSEEQRIADGLTHETNVSISEATETNPLERDELSADAESQALPRHLRPGFGSKGFDQASSKPSSLVQFVVRQKETMLKHWRRHLIPDSSEPAREDRNQKLASAEWGFLAVMAVVALIGFGLAFWQTSILKTDVGTLRREMVAVRTRLEKLEPLLTNKKRGDMNQAQTSPPNIAANNQLDAVQSPLNLSTDEVQIIKGFVKPAPTNGNASPGIAQGDLIESATIPLPSPVTDKIPKLLGARFLTRNGAIIISAKDSRRADIVLPPN